MRAAAKHLANSGHTPSPERAVLDLQPERKPQTSQCNAPFPDGFLYIVYCWLSLYSGWISSDYFDVLFLCLSWRTVYVQLGYTSTAIPACPKKFPFF